MADQATQTKVSGIELEFTARRPLGAASGVERWSVRAALRDPDADVPPGGGDAGAEPVGRLEILAVNLARCRDPWGALDASNDEVAHIGETVFDINTGQLAERFDSRLQRAGERVLVVDYVELEPGWQRRNLAALLVAESLDQLSADCRVVVCLPGPLGRRDLADEDYDEAVRRMQAVWSQVGFVPYEEGVWFLVPHPRTLEETLSRLRAQQGLG